jgi:FMN phosphatase YigB (HAD superfamily)
MAERLEAVIFDLGNVLIKLDFIGAAKRLAAHCRYNYAEIVSFLLDAPESVAYNRGEISSLQYYRKMKKHFHLKIDLKEFVQIWNSGFLHYKEMEELVEKLRRHDGRRLRLICLSNVNELNWEHLRKHFPILKKMHARIASYQVKLAKPDERIYWLAVKAAKAQPERIFYTDDRKDLVAGGRKIGLRAYLFRGHRDFCRKLKKFGIRIK